MNKASAIFPEVRNILLGVVMTLFLAACAAHPPAPRQVANADYHYVIGTGDTLHITVWHSPELSSVTQVRPDGRVSTPLINGIQAAGLTADELATRLQKQLGNYVRDPMVTVVVSDFHGAIGQQINIVGAAIKPQTVPYRAKMTLLDAMIAAGGLTLFADGNNAVLIRDGKSYSIHVDNLLQGKIADNVPLLPGDTIVIPQSRF